MHGHIKSLLCRVDAWCRGKGCRGVREGEPSHAFDIVCCVLLWTQIATGHPSCIAASNVSSAGQTLWERGGWVIGGKGGREAKAVEGVHQHQHLCTSVLWILALVASSNKIRGHRMCTQILNAHTRTHTHTPWGTHAHTHTHTHTRMHKPAHRLPLCPPCTHAPCIPADSEKLRCSGTTPWKKARCR